jgi:hypothetical protein
MYAKTINNADQHILDYIEFSHELNEWAADIEHKNRLEDMQRRNKWIDDYVKSFPIPLDI